jgi:hypothetical protein
MERFVRANPDLRESKPDLSRDNSELREDKRRGKARNPGIL